MVYPNKALARDGLHVSLLVSLGRVGLGSIPLTIKGRQQGNVHRRHKKE